MPELTKRHKDIKLRQRLSGINLMVFVLLFGLVGGVAILHSLAAPATIVQLYLSPASQNLTPGSNFTVQVRLTKNDSTQVEAVKAYLNFPSALLSVNSLTPDPTTFNRGSEAIFDNTAGTVHLIRSTFNPPRPGDYLVATISFTAKGAGTATVSFDNQSMATDTSYMGRGATNLLTGKVGGTYTLAVPAVPKPPSTPPPSTPPPPTPPSTKPPAAKVPLPGTVSTPPTPPSASPFAPVISGLAVQPGYSDAQISWQTANAGSSKLAYGSSPDRLDTVLDAGTAVKPTVVLPNLKAAAKYFFEVTAAGGNQSTKYDGSFSTLGWPVVVSVKSAGGPVSGVTITIMGLSRTTDKNGQAQFELAPGNYRAEIKSGGKTYQLPLVVKDQPQASPGLANAQGFSYNLAKVRTIGITAELGAAAAAAIAVLGTIMVTTNRMKKGHHKHPKKPQPKAAAPPPPPKHAPPLKPAAPPVDPPIKEYKLPPPHATKFPWITGVKPTKPKNRGSSIAADDNYVEPEDMFEEGEKRLSQEKIDQPPH